MLDAGVEVALDLVEAQVVELGPLDRELGHVAARVVRELAAADRLAERHRQARARVVDRLGVELAGVDQLGHLGEPGADAVLVDRRELAARRTTAAAACGPASRSPAASRRSRTAAWPRARSPRTPRTSRATRGPRRVGPARSRRAARRPRRRGSRSRGASSASRRTGGTRTASACRPPSRSA